MSLHRIPLWALWLLSPVLVLSQPPEDRLACVAGIVIVSVLAIGWSRVRTWADRTTDELAASYRRKHP